MKYLPSIIAALSALAGLFAPQVQALVAAHPSVALVMSGLYAIFAHFMPSPSK